jgi:hypothetical protein
LCPRLDVGFAVLFVLHGIDLLMWIFGLRGILTQRRCAGTYGKNCVFLRYSNSLYPVYCRLQNHACGLLFPTSPAVFSFNLSYLYTMEKILPSILAAFSPLLFSYIFKNIENKNKSNVRKNDLDEALQRLNFLKSYLDTQIGFGKEGQTEELKEKLYRDAEGVKAGIDEIYRERDEITPYERLYTFQKIFLTFRPASVFGWLLHIVFYFGLLFDAFMLIGFLTDDEGNMVSGALEYNMQDTGMVIIAILFALGTLGVNFLAIRNYKVSTKSI